MTRPLRAHLPAPLRVLARRGRALTRRLPPWVRRKFLSRSRMVLIALSLMTVGIGVAAVEVSATWFSPGTVILPILAGGLLLRIRPLRALLLVVAGVLAYDALMLGIRRVGPGLLTTILVTAAFAYVLSRTRQQLGVLGMRGEAMLLELRDRLREQGELPPLPEGWGSRVVLEQAGGSSFGGDFVVSVSDGKMLEVALVDVSGKGIDAGTRALMLSGAFGGLLGSVPTEEFLPACNAYLRRQPAGEGFVTAVHLTVDLLTGEYVVESAGHPPAVHFAAGSGTWRVTEARGLVLGVMADLRCTPERGTLRPGDALMLYTDGLVEAPGRDIDAGIDRLLGEADRLVTHGFRAHVHELVTTMRGATNDDCALVLIWRG